MSITVLTIPVTEWARMHPEMFFRDGKATARNIVEQLVDGARVLGAPSVEDVSFKEWWIVAAQEDWFPNARFPLPPDFRFGEIIVFPEQGQNCTRPEFVVAAFARDVIVMGAKGDPVILGTVSSTDEIHCFLARTKSWRRVIAFRGIRLEPPHEQPTSSSD
ncbi:hypothetical protein [Variovorax sp. UC122_21]|uniref:hypothetical protein n=1 Tax=Variovorax sp. UC122_21 TaxID=3374554 RepID=UPI00375676C1